MTRAAVDRGGAAEDGRLTDSQGRTVDFKNTVIIMTSNIAGEVEEGSDLTFTARNDELAPVQQAHAAKQ